MTKKELRKISLQFRTLSSQMLKVNEQEEITYIQAFYTFITSTPIIHDYILSCHKTDYDFGAIFKELGYHNKLVLPVDQTDLIDYEFQLIQFILNGKRPLFYYGEYYTTSNQFSDMISAFMRKVIEPFVVALRSYLEISLIDAEDSESPELPEEKTVFLSYCQKDADIADIIDSGLTNRLQSKAKISRDVRDVAYHESFKKFMRSIRAHDYVVILLSDHYLKSRNCLFEMIEVLKDSRYISKILFIIIDEKDKKYLKNPSEERLGANVFSQDGPAQYILYWRKQEADLQAQIDSIGDPTYAISQVNEKRIVQRILLDLPEFLEFVRDNKGLPLATHIAEGFSSMLQYMGLNS